MEYKYEDICRWIGHSFLQHQLEVDKMSQAYLALQNQFNSLQKELQDLQSKYNALNSPNGTT